MSKGDKDAPRAWEVKEVGILLPPKLHDLEPGEGKAMEELKKANTANVVELTEMICNTPLFEALGKADVSQPFRDDVEYLWYIELGIIAMYQSFTVKGGSFANVIVKEMTTRQIFLKDIQKAIDMVHELIVSIVCKRLPLMAKKPLVLRLCEELKLSPSETRGFVYMLVCDGGVELRTFTDIRPTAVHIARFGGMNSNEFMNFLGEERLHFMQGLVGPIDSRTKNVSTQSLLKMPREVVAALYMVRLTEAEFLKLDKTSLADLLEEAGLVEYLDGDSRDAPAGEESEEGESHSIGDEQREELHGTEERKRPRGDDKAVPQAKVRKVEFTQSVSPPPENDKEDKEDKDDKDGKEPGEDEGSEVLPSWRSTATGLLAPNTPISLDQGAYTHDLQYLDDVFKLLAAQIRIRTTESDLKDEDPEAAVTPRSKQEAQLRELKGKERMLKIRIEKRMARTKAQGGKLPMMEELQRKRGLSNFEKMVLLLLVGNIMSHDILIAANGKYVMRGEAQRECTVGYLLYVLCESLEERMIRRKVFYKNAPLLRDGMITVCSKSYGAGDLMECSVEIDRRMVDSLMGIETEFSEIVEGSHLYSSTIQLDHVVLPKEHKELILSTISNYDAFQRCKARVGLDDIVSYGSGLVMLFYGPSGTGKTMLANAIAKRMDKKVLLVSLQQVKASGKSPELLRFVFREAKLNNAIVFFDECDSFFETRENNPVITSLLQELEKYNGIMILATNKAHTLDEAMNRRITLAMEFQLPDHHMRSEIWRRHIPSSLKVCDEVDWAALAMDYELSGGLIKNALLTSIAQAVARENGNDNPTLRMVDLIKGAKTQLRSFFKKDATVPNQVVPQHSLEDCVFDRHVTKGLEEIVTLQKGKRHIQSNWGFESEQCDDLNMLILFYGPSGVGKSYAAEAVAYECGHVMRVVNSQELIQKHGSTIDSLFEQAKHAGAMLVLDEAQNLFNFSQESREILQLLNYHARRYTRPVIVISRTEGTTALDASSAGLIANRTIRFSIPSEELRLKHWKRLVPKQVPLADDFSFEEVSRKILSPGAIRNAIYFACAKAAVQPSKKLTSRLIEEAIDDVIRLKEGTHPSIYT